MGLEGWRWGYLNPGQWPFIGCQAGKQVEVICRWIVDEGTGFGGRLSWWRATPGDGGEKAGMARCAFLLRADVAPSRDGKYIRVSSPTAHEIHTVNSLSPSSLQSWPARVWHRNSSILSKILIRPYTLFREAISFFQTSQLPCNAANKLYPCPIHRPTRFDTLVFRDGPHRAYCHGSRIPRLVPGRRDILHVMMQQRRVTRPDDKWPLEKNCK
ncbi:hypothetical protein F5I97DRAFT_423040 [Phlebopus sp. FC_14]|nr:hypothetical protein F5I97DRAFT_423040 [Phlebopus sp. FC_14]